ncbi:hypothetical protein [Ruminiclostridium josui]|uniref:hypothetical protein n=1 Tax=Ruminiclostridium josui TaxID=1499 RepID=UPI0004667BC1|nr:hypothetical protein [Ruminiclostridium josui]
MNNATRAKKIALSGILLGFTVICVFLASVLPTSKLSLYAISSLFISIIIIEFGLKAGWTFYAASAVLTAVLIPRLEVLPYIVFFGVYGLLKLYFERQKSRVLEYVLKLVYFNICLLLGFVFIKEFLMMGVTLTAPVYVVAALVEIVFVVYDYVYTLFVRFYSSTLKPKLKI